MDLPDPPAGPPSLLRITLRRAFSTGRIYLLFGTGYSLLLSVALALASPSGFAGAIVVMVPIFAVVAGLGGLMVFTNDRIKGVFEYLIAYGIPPRRLLANTLVASLLLVTVLVGSTLAVGLGTYVAAGSSISSTFALTLGLYTVPMSYAATAFAGTVGMYWTSLSSPRAGINSPVGLIPIVGIAPPVVALVLVAIAPAFALAITVGIELFVAGLVLVLLGQIGRLLRQERLLSPT